MTQPAPAKVPKSFIVAVPTSDARSRTQEVLDANRYQAERLYASRDAQRRLVRMLRDADTQLSQKLRTLLPSADGTRTWTQQDTEATLALVRMQLAEVQAKLARQLEANGSAARELGARETTQILEMFEGLNPGSIRPLSIRAAHQLSLGTVSAQYQTSVARYGMQAITSIQRELTAGVLIGRTFDEMTSRLQRSEPLLSRRWMAERMVRTECLSSYNLGHMDEMQAQKAEAFPDLKKKLIETFDRRTAQDSYVAHGEVRELNGLFVDGKGRHYLQPPGRPNDRAVVIPWRDAWEDAPATRQRAQVVVSGVPQSDGQIPVAAKAVPPPVLVASGPNDVIGKDLKVGKPKARGPAQDEAVAFVKSLPAMPGHPNAVSFASLGIRQAAADELAEIESMRARVRANGVPIDELMRLAENRPVPALPLMTRSTVAGIDRAAISAVASVDIDKYASPVLFQSKSGSLIPADDRSHALVAAASAQNRTVPFRVITHDNLDSLDAMRAPAPKNGVDFGQRIYDAHSRGDNGAVRDTLRQWIASDGKAMSLDVMGRAESRLVTYVDSSALPPGVAGTHSWRGHMRIQNGYNDNVFFGFGDLAASRTPTPAFAEAVSLLLHEESHGFSPIASVTYKGAGVVMEEVGTELIARRAVRRLGAAYAHIAEAPSFRGRAFVEGGGIYGDYMKQFFEKLSKAGIPEKDMSTRIENAFIDLRAHPPKELISDPSVYAREISSRLGKDLTSAQREAARKALEDLVP